jgi:hypothetical protein
MCLAVCSATSALNARSVSIWGELKEHSKFAKETIPAMHNVAEFFKVLTIPTPSSELINSRAAIDFKYGYGKAAASGA